MNYYFSKTIQSDFETAVSRVTKALKTEGFGILTEIDVQETLKKKLNVDFRKYKILGACNPPFAYEALKAEDTIGTMLPCNVIVQEEKEGEIKIAAIDPIASMKSVKNKNLNKIAGKIREKLEKVIQKL